MKCIFGSDVHWSGVSLDDNIGLLVVYRKQSVLLHYCATSQLVKNERKFRPTEASPDSEVTVEEKLPIFFLIFNYSILVCH